jgi:hypothetical protein
MVQKRSRNERRKAQQGVQTGARKPSPGGGNDGPLTISYWAVAFLDLLGYRSVLDGMDVYPLPNEGEEHARVHRSFKAAVHMRRRLLGGMNSLMESQQNTPLLPELLALPVRERKMVEQWNRVQILQLPGPDHIVLGCSLAPDEGSIPVRDVHSILFGASAAMLFQLWLGADDVTDTRPLRGGIDIAPGCFVNPEGFLYSPALTRAYKLESRKALYPRTIIGERLPKFLQECASDATVNDPVSIITATLARECTSMLFHDRDGVLCLDFLGDTVREWTDPEQRQKLAAGAWRYAKLAQACARRSGDQYVIDKYEWLVDYMRGRVPGWGVTVENGD